MIPNLEDITEETRLENLMLLQGCNSERHRIEGKYCLFYCLLIRDDLPLGEKLDYLNRFYDKEISELEIKQGRQRREHQKHIGYLRVRE